MSTKFREQVRRTKVGHAVEFRGAARWAPGMNAGVCGHKGCKLPATEGESFRIKNPPGSKSLTRVEYFARCDKHEHSHWKAIGWPRRR